MTYALIIHDYLLKIVGIRLGLLLLLLFSSLYLLMAVCFVNPWAGSFWIQQEGRSIDWTWSHGFWRWPKKWIGGSLWLSMLFDL